MIFNALHFKVDVKLLFPKEDIYVDGELNILHQLRLMALLSHNE